MKIVAIVQARMGSTRYPKKVLCIIDQKPMIDLLILRLAKSRLIDKIIIATTLHPSDDILSSHIEKMGLTCFRGSEIDVLDRYLNAARYAKADVIVRITGDCPLVDAEIVDSAIDKFLHDDVDYCSNIDPPTFPDGLDVEVFSFSALEKCSNEAISLYDREHVTPYIRNSCLFKKSSLHHQFNLSHLRWTVDDPADHRVVENVFLKFNPDIYFSWQDILKLQMISPELFIYNQNTPRNEGAMMNTGQKLWKRAKNVIPGGNMLLSKRPEMFLPEKWPTYFSKSKGCMVWDLDGKSYIDMSIMGVGTNILGYSNTEVDQAVLNTISNGNMSTLNCPEEVYLAEKLIELHPWAEMVRLARTGGEANAIAIRIARAATGRDKIAICGYHGWHDWYLSSNLSDDKNLDGHLLPGLEPKGVPRELKGTTLPFTYNNFDELKELASTHQLGAIKMEVSRNTSPDNSFLKKVRALATKENIVLIFDECTSGFRQTNGGLHKIYGVDPDMAIFGKALGNGYAINAIIGRREVMEAAQSTFISSTFWTERIGPTAALKTLEVMSRINSWNSITEVGLQIRKRWQDLATKHSLKITHWGLPALTGFSFESDNNLAYKTIVTQEMLKKGYLASNSIYTSISHTQEIVDGYFNELDPIFGLIKECSDGRDPFSVLKNQKICHGGFKRLN